MRPGMLASSRLVELERRLDQTDESGWRTETNGSKVWPINDYLLEGRRVAEWITPGAVKYAPLRAT
jgi:hypothetical protein